MPAPEGQAPDKIRIQCMGQFRVLFPDTAGTEVKWRTRKAQELFAYLFQLQGEGVSKETLTALLWPESGTKSATALFHTTLYSIRQAFAQGGWTDMVLYEKKKYSINMQLVSSDLEELAAYFHQPQQSGHSPEHVMRLYTGRYMGNTGYLWSYATAKRLEDEYLKALKAGAHKRAKERQPGLAIPFLQRMLEVEPYDEEIVSQLIACLYQSGRQSEAKQQYDRMVKLYRDDLELDFEKTFRELVDHRRSL